MTRQPFRTQPSALSGEELEAANRARPRDVPRWESYEASLARMESEAEDTTPLRAWLTHPDERVVIATIAHEDWGLRVHEAQELQELVTERAIQGARSEGLAWTPLIEKIFECDMWPNWRKVHDAQSGASQVGVWLRRYGRPRDVRELVAAFEGPTMSRVVAANAPVLAEDIVDTLARRGALAELASNPALPEWGAERVIAAALAPLYGEPRAAATAVVTTKSVLGAFRGRERISRKRWSTGCFGPGRVSPGNRR